MLYLQYPFLIKSSYSKAYLRFYTYDVDNFLKNSENLTFFLTYHFYSRFNCIFWPFIKI
jgi:hypothetical protein